MGQRLGREVKLARSRGRKKKKIEKRRAVVWVGNEWRKRWIEAGQEKWVGQRLGRRYRLARWKKREKYLRKEGERSEE